MTILSVVYASAPTNELIIPTLEIQLPERWVRICASFEDQLLGVNGEMVWFEAGSLSITLPSKNSTSVQTLTFGVPAIDGAIQRYVDEALEADLEVKLIYREYLESDKSAPSRAPTVMTIRGGIFEDVEAQFEAGYYDILNTAWPRPRYTADTAPGIRFT